MLEQKESPNTLVATTVNLHNQIVQKPLRYTVKASLKNYLAEMKNSEISELYELVLCEVEQPMLDMVMQHARGNQTRAANIMGINRGTLRKKLKKYGMD